jgi:predicted transcriptional regulator
MSADDNDHDDPEDTDVRERIEQEADRAIEQFDEGIVDLLAWVLDTETRARIYVHLRQHPESTSEEIAEGTGLYPSTVREALAALTDEEVVTRQKRESDGAGNNPYEYSAISPSDLVNTIVGDIQSELNTVFNLDDHIGGETTLEPDDEPVTISVEDADDDTTDDPGVDDRADDETDTPEDADEDDDG